MNVGIQIGIVVTVIVACTAALWIAIKMAEKKGAADVNAQTATNNLVAQQTADTEVAASGGIDDAARSLHGNSF